MSATYRALADGDAARIATEYLDTLGISELRTYRESVDENPLPEHLSFPVFAVRGVPDLFGATMVRAIQMDGGRRAIERAFRHPPRRQVEMFDPTAIGSRADSVRPPKLGNAEEPVGRARPLGALTLYTALALRIENEAAMRAADEVVASSARVYLDGSLICVRARFGTRGPASSRLVAGTLRDWLGEGPPHNGTVTEQADGIVRFDSCEGENTAFQPFGIGDLVATPLVRNGFVLGRAEILRQCDAQ